MKKSFMNKVMALLLVLAMAVQMLPMSAFAANGAHITVAGEAPTTAQTTVGGQYILDLTTVFTDGEGHSLTYSLDKDYGEHTKIDGNNLVYTSSEAGEVTVTVTAVCENGDSAVHAITVTTAAAQAGADAQYGYNETAAKSVKVTVTISNDGIPVQGNDDNETALAHMEVEVPYFDLADYGLENYYRYGTENGQGAYVNATVIERPTLLHLYIYMIERYYMGLPAAQCGQGSSSGVLSYSGNTDIAYFDGTSAYSSNGSSALTISGSATSMYMNSFWGHSENLLYYRNHLYPLMSDGWGATADYILLSEGDDIDLGMFSNWNFYQDGAFITLDKEEYTADAGTDLTITTYEAATSSVGGSSGTLTVFTESLNVNLYNSEWGLVESVSATANGDGTYTLKMPETAGTYYVMASDPNAKTENADIIPGTAKVTVTEKTVVEPETPEESETPEVLAYLSELKATKSSSSTSEVYTITPELANGVFEYTAVVPEAYSQFYAWATLSENAPEGSTITAKWTNLNNNTEKTQTITSGKSSGQSLIGAAKYGYYENAVVFEVGTGEDIQSYTVNIVRSQPRLSSLAITSSEGTNIRMNETFSASKYEYTATTIADKVLLNVEPSAEGHTVTFNGSQSNEVVLTDGENTISIVVKNELGYETTYTLKITKVDKIGITFKLTPEDAAVKLVDPLGDTVLPDEEGVYTIMASSEYTYTVSKYGYVGQKNTFTLTESGEIEVILTQPAENESIDKTIYAQWANFRNGENHLGITNAATPYAPEDAELLWASKYGTGWSAAPGAPIIVDDYLITYVGSTIKKIDMNTGAVVAEGQMVGSSSFSIVPPTYADGIIFIGLSGGRIQAFNAKTLESLWVYTDDLGGQPNCPITYKDGHIYAGFWNSETKDANFVCVSASDDNINKTTEAKVATWAYARAGGFYWAGAYATDKYVVVGTDDGKSGYSSETASLLVFDRYTGALVDSEDGFRGDVRSNVSYDPTSDRIFFTTKGGQLCNARLNKETGEISDVHKTVIKNANGTAYAMSTCTPSVYNGRIYIGISGDGQFSSNSGHAIGVYDLAADGTMTQAYAYQIMGYPQTSAMVTTAYAQEDGSVYIYLPYNYTPGGISVLKDKPGQTEPVTTTDSGYSEVFTPQSPLSQYCICSAIADSNGTIYYKNDSSYMMAVTPKIESIEVKSIDSITEAADGTITAEGLKVVANLINGVDKDISNYVALSKDETGKYIVSYTYGFDSANYGLKTLTAEIPVLTVLWDKDYYQAGETATLQMVVMNAEQLDTVNYSINYDDTAMTLTSAVCDNAFTAIRSDVDKNMGSVMRVLSSESSMSGEGAVLVDTLTFMMTTTGTPSVEFVTVAEDTDFGEMAVYMSDAATDAPLITAVDYEVSILEAQEDAAEVDALIGTIGKVTEASGGIISNVRAAYDALSDLAKSYVVYEETLVEAESSYDLWTKGDVNLNKRINLQDMSRMLGAQNTQDAKCDINIDTIVNMNDFSVLLTNYGARIQ